MGRGDVFMSIENIERLRKKLERLIQHSEDLSCSEIYNASRELDIVISEYHRSLDKEKKERNRLEK
jgi:hypothetical protein